MKYINSNYLLFDKYNEKIIRENGWIINSQDDVNHHTFIDFATDSNEVYARFDIKYNGFSNYCAGSNLFQLCFKNTFIMINVSQKSNTLNLVKCLVSDNKDIFLGPTYGIGTGTTYRVLIYANTETGNVSLQINNNKYSYNIPELIGDKMERVKIALERYNKSCTPRLKDIIISDSPIRMNEEITEIPITLDSSEWSNTDSTYSTGETGKKIIFTPNLNSLGRCNIKSAELIFEGSQSSESISSVKTSIGGETKSTTLSDTGLSIYGVCAENPDLTKEISIES